ncbi:zinc finger BED domain-containing protein RICESLEEPER 1-like [Quercus lobata]|uniref:zinc finger BED domain-containing protein RICESLEEPER 1-like n=1 Tax=Quercus lobata TaxID=97700 RepID=UPI001248D553|nr:zinc finger BED domain-containing protein RICESLEEPER 1-like [Quercus lobata]
MQRSEISAPSPSKIQYEVTSALPTYSKRRRLVSEVWNDFNKVEVGGKFRAICKHCCKDFSGSSKSGTTHLKNHLLRCSAIKSGESCKEMISPSKTGDFKNPTVIDGNSVFDEERSRLDVVRMIIKHGYPLNMVEHEYFKVFVKNLQPMFKFHSQDTLKAGILHVYREEKEKLCKHLDGLKLKKKILAVKNVGYNYTGETLFGMVKSLLLEWNIDKKLCSITVESSSSNDQMVKTLESWLGKQGYHPFRGKLFHIRCITHIINLLVQDGLDEIGDILHKIRKAIKYINETTIGKEKFQEVVKKLNLQSKDITSQGVPIRWDSTFFMLESALEFREAFSYLQSSDCDFPVNLSMEEWDKAKVMHKCLIVFYDGICSFLGSKCLTTNVYFRKIFDIHHNLIQWQKSEHTFIRSVAKKMSETFDKYFDYCTSVSAIAAVFDPRTKLDFVHYSFTELYGGHTKKYLLIDDALGHIFDEYAKGRSSQASTSYDDNYSDILDRCSIDI